MNFDSFTAPGWMATGACFFLDSTKTPGNKLTRLKNDTQRLPTPPHHPDARASEVCEECHQVPPKEQRKNISKEVRIPKDSVSYKGETRQEARFGRQE